MKKLITLLLLFTITINYSQTSSAEIKQIIKEQSDGKPGQAVSTVYSDTKQAVKQVYEDTKAFSPKIEKAVTSIAGSLKTTADKLWNILIKQQQVWSYCFLLLTLCSCFNWFIFYKRLNPSNIEFETVERDIIGNIPNPNYNEYTAQRNSKDPNAQTYIKGPVGKEQYLSPKIIPSTNKYTIVHLILCITMSLFSAYHFSSMLTGFMNPEYGALQTILEVANKLK